MTALDPDSTGGSDTITGGNGDEVLLGGAGNVTITGGSGSDVDHRPQRHAPISVKRQITHRLERRPDQWRQRHHHRR